MAGTRALLASIGVSVALVAAAALSLLAVSVLFAFGWTSASVPESVRTQPLVLADTAPSPTSSAGTRARSGGRPIVAAAPARRPKRSATVRTRTVRVPSGATTSRIAGAPRSTPALTPPTTHSIGVSKSPPPVASANTTGEGVRKVGDELSATVKDTGTAVAEVTQPLAPPVSTVVQKVFNVVAEVLQATTGGLAGAVDKLLPAKR
jgi:hypothetical protein